MPLIIATVSVNVRKIICQRANDRVHSFFSSIWYGSKFEAFDGFFVSTFEYGKINKYWIFIEIVMAHNSTPLCALSFVFNDFIISKIVYLIPESMMSSCVRYTDLLHRFGIPFWWCETKIRRVYFGINLNFRTVKSNKNHISHFNQIRVRARWNDRRECEKKANEK